MKKIFIVSLCRNGILGGAIYADSERLTYRTGKLTVSPRIRNLAMPLKDIAEVSKSCLLCLPTVTIKMRNEEEFKFLVFARNSFFKTLKELGLDTI